MATYTPPTPAEPGGWEFTDEELQQEADKHFAKMCEDTDEIAEAFGPDAWGNDDMQVERDLGRMLNELRHARRGKHDLYITTLENEIGKTLADYALSHIGGKAQTEADNTVVDSMEELNQVWPESANAP